MSDQIVDENDEERQDFTEFVFVDLDIEGNVAGEFIVRRFATGHVGDAVFFAQENEQFAAEISADDELEQIEDETVGMVLVAHAKGEGDVGSFGSGFRAKMVGDFARRRCSARMQCNAIETRFTTVWRPDYEMGAPNNVENFFPWYAGDDAQDHVFRQVLILIEGFDFFDSHCGFAFIMIRDVIDGFFKGASGVQESHAVVFDDNHSVFGVTQAFFYYDAFFFNKLFGGKCGKKSHTGQKSDRGSEIPVVDFGVVVGVAMSRRGVERAAHLILLDEEFGGREVARALETHVFDEMRGAA